MSKELEISYKDITELKPYGNNPRRNEKAIKPVAESIKQFGFKVPIVIDKNNVIVCGHTRYEASKTLGLKEVPCIIADDLNANQIKAFRLADNRVSELAKWDWTLLEIELASVSDFMDMGEFSFDMSGIDEVIPDISNYQIDDHEIKENHRNKTMESYNMDYVIQKREEEPQDFAGFYELPVIRKTDVIPDGVCNFNDCQWWKGDRANTAVHFYVDDYKFERIWNNPEKYVEVLKEYKCVISPDFSLYFEMPFAMKIWNTYRNRFIGNFLQSHGIEVIPNVRFSSTKDFHFCFDGLEKGGVIAISVISLNNNEEVKKLLYEGITETIKRLEPTTIIIYGTKNKLDYDFGNVKTIYFAIDQFARYNKEEK